MTSGKLLAAVAFVGLVSGSAYAADPGKSAEGLLAKGVELRRQGRTAEALDVFEKAHAIDPSARALAQIASAELALHRVVEAEAHLEQALARHDSPWIENATNRNGLEQMLADVRRQVARLEIVGTPGTEVAVSGKVIGVLPLSEPVHLAAGLIEISATAPGRKPVSKVVVANAGEQTAVNVDPEPPRMLPTPAPAAISAPAPAPLVGRLDRPAWRKWTGGALLVAGLAAGAAGLLLLTLDGEPLCDNPPGVACEEQYDTKTAGWIAIAGGAAAAMGGATLLIWPGRERPIAAHVRPGGLAISGRF